MHPRNHEKEAPRGGAALLLAAALAIACDGVSHPTAPPLAQPPVSAALGGVWVGERSVAVVTRGRDTCLGRLLAARAPGQVELNLSEQLGPEAFWGGLSVDDAGEWCTIRGGAKGTNLSFTECGCNVNCWWESFECDGRCWSFCRDAIGIGREFLGKPEAGRLTGLQNYRFHATARGPGYEVELFLRYDLHR